MIFQKSLLSFFKRERQDKTYTIWFASLLLSVLLLTFINTITQSMRFNIENKSSELLGADLVIESTEPIPEKLVNYIKQDKRLESTSVVQFLTMLKSDKGLRLSSVKALESNYPLRGDLVLKNGQSVKGPKPNEIWIDESLLKDLDIKMGDSVKLGVSLFKVTGIIDKEPDRGLDFMSLAPHAIFSADSLLDTQVIQPGSKLTYKFMVSSDKTENIQILEKWIDSQVFSQIDYFTTKKNKLNVQNQLNNAEDYINLGALLNMGLACIAIALTSLEFVKSKFHDIAVLRVMGASLKEILFAYVFGLLRMGIPAILIGAGLGSFLGFVCITWFGLPSFSFEGIYKGSVLGLGNLLIFSIPPLVLIREMSTLSLIQQCSIPFKNTYWWMLQLGSLGFFLLLVYEVGHFDWIGNSLFFILIYGCFIFLILMGLYYWFGRMPLKSFSLRQGFKLARSRKLTHLFSVTGFSLGFGFFSLMVLLTQDLWQTWSSHLPTHQPNFFAINLQENEVKTLKDTFITKKISSSDFYPILSGQLYQINEAKGDRFYRPLNLTAVKSIPKENEVLKGSWPAETKTDIHGGISYPLSVESGFASRMKMNIGDSLYFHVGGINLIGHITQLRSVKWDTFMPNFFVIFPEEAFKEIESRYMVSFYFDNKEGGLLSIFKDYPSVTLFDITQILSSIRNLLSTLQKSLIGLLMTTIIFSILVFSATMQATLVERQFEIALLKVLGGTKKLIQSLYHIEFGFIGVVVGFSSILFANLMFYLLCHYVFNLAYTFNLFWFFVLPSTGILLLIVLSQWFILPLLRDVTAKSLNSNVN